MHFTAESMDFCYACRVVEREGRVQKLVITKFLTVQLRDMHNTGRTEKTGGTLNFDLSFNRLFGRCTIFKLVNFDFSMRFTVLVFQFSVKPTNRICLWLMLLPLWVYLLMKYGQILASCLQSRLLLDWKFMTTECKSKI